MKLPNLKYTDRISKTKQIKFGGLNHTLGAKDGELWDMRNLTADHAPLLATREKRHLWRKLEEPGGIFSWDGMYWVDGTGFYYNGERKGTVTEGKKQFASMGAYIVILPDKCCYNRVTDEYKSMEAKWHGDSLIFTGGELFEKGMAANAIRCEGVAWDDYFRPGDAVTISGCTINPENNKTPVIQEIQGDTLLFSEYCFTIDKEDERRDEYLEIGSLSIERRVPDLLYICENENRLWGCTETEICASKLGDVFNWNVFEDLASGSWNIAPAEAGSFTGCVAYKGFPTFFKENRIYKVYGSIPGNFSVVSSATLGLAPGSSGSLAIAGETLFYLSSSGYMAYSGGIPQPIGEAFGQEHIHSAVAGSDGLRYFVSVVRQDGSTGLYVYDTQRGMWHLEDEVRVTHFAKEDGCLYFLTEEGEIWITGNTGSPPEGCQEEPDFEWIAEFSDFTQEDPNKKGLSKLQLRLELDEGASMQVWLQCDSDGIWLPAGNIISEGVKRSYYLPIVPRRADHYRLKLTGTGGCRIYSLVHEIYSGSELKSKSGRN